MLKNLFIKNKIKKQQLFMLLYGKRYGCHSLIFCVWFCCCPVCFLVQVQAISRVPCSHVGKLLQHVFLKVICFFHLKFLNTINLPSQSGDFMLYLFSVDEIFLSVCLVLIL